MYLDKSHPIAPCFDSKSHIYQMKIYGEKIIISNYDGHVQVVDGHTNQLE